MNDTIDSIRREKSNSTKDTYQHCISGPIESYSYVMRYPDGRRTEVRYSVTEIAATGLLDWNRAYDVNQVETHTTGRRGQIEKTLDMGINPFPTPVNTTATESPAVVCGYTQSGNPVVSTETFARNYGDIFAPESTGYVVVLDSSITQSPGYDKSGPEARITQHVQPREIKALIVGNETMFQKAMEEAQKEGLSIPIIRLSKSESEL